MIRTFYQYFIKRLFNFFILKFIISIFVILFLSSKLAYGAKSILLKTNKSLVDKKYNLIVSLGSRSSGGYKLEFNKIKNKNKKTYVYFNEIKPPKNSKNIAVISYPFCILKIDNLNEYKIKIKKKRSKFFPFSIFH